jgi:ElaB/YqjD/DUF883 family membrane-anchored ribosome-binding protein
MHYHHEGGFMTEMTQERKAPANAGGGESVTEQAKEKVQETAGQVQQQVGEKAQEVRGQAANGIKQQLDSRSTQAGEQVSATADALRRVGEQLKQEGQEAPARYARQAAQPVERLGRYLTDADGERILRDAEQFARRRPWVTAVGGVALGFVVARFIKASSTSGGQQQMQAPNGDQTTLPMGLEPGNSR